MINILLVDGHRLFSEGIEALLSNEEDFHIVGVASNKLEAFDHIQAERPDVIIANLHLNSIDGEKLTVGIKEKYPETKIIFFMTELDEKTVIEGVFAGVDGILLYSIDLENFTQAIRNAHRDQVIFSGDVAKVLARRVINVQYDNKDLLGRKLENRNIQLTARELDVAYLLAKKRSNIHIANELHLSEGTVKNYVSNLYQKLNVIDRVEMIEYINKLLEDHSLHDTTPIN